MLETLAPTQTRYPWRAAVRTALAYIAGAGIVVPLLWAAAQETLGVYLSPTVIAALAWTVGLILAASAFVTRIMAIPAVNDWLTRVLNIGAAPKGPAYTPERVDYDQLDGAEVDGPEDLTELEAEADELRDVSGI